jgi:hypothetical protein
MSALSFVRPELLWALPLAVLPILIHLINRHRARRRPFAAIDFLLRVQRRTARRLLLRQLLLLLIRTALVLSLVLAAAGPRLEPRAAAAASLGPTTTVLVLDASFSMRARDAGGTRFDAALEAAREHVRGQGPQDRACLVLAGRDVRVLVEPCTDSRAALLDALDELRPEYGRSDLSAALGRAAALLQPPRVGPGRVLLLTDGAAHAFPGQVAWPGDEAPEVELRDVAPDESRDNHAVLGVEAGLGGALLALEVRLQLTGQEPAADLPLEVRLGEATTRGFASLQPGQTLTKLFSLAPPATEDDAGPLQGAASLPPDRLAEDDTCPFLAAGRRPVRALLVDGDMRAVLHQDELFYLERALAPDGGHQATIQLQSLTPDRLRPEHLDGVQVVFLANVRALTPEQSQALVSFVEAGGGLFLSCGDQLDPQRADEWLRELTPWPVRDVISIGPAEPDGVHRQGLGFGELDATHPVLRPFAAGGDRPLEAVRTFRAAILEPGRAGPEVRVLLRYADGTPALVEGRRRAGRVMLLTTTLDRDWTHWPARASFLPFLQRATAYLAGRLEEQPAVEVEVDEPASLPLLPEAGGVRVRRPDGEARVLRAAPGASQVVLAETDRPGVYALEQLPPDGDTPLRARAAAALVVHPPRTELDLTLAPAERLQALVGEATRLKLAGAGAEGGRAQAWLLLLLALGLLVLEALLIRR